MGLKCNVDMNAMRKRIEDFYRVVEEKQIKRLQILGEEAVKLARNEHPNNWQDQTGNLRSSIGYMVFKDGEPVVESVFEQIAIEHQEGVNYDGAQRGMQFCKTIGEKTHGIALVVVAGMNYAQHVEAGHATKNGHVVAGRDVLTSAEHFVERALPILLEELKSNIIKAAE